MTEFGGGKDLKETFPQCDASAAQLDRVKALGVNAGWLHHRVAASQGGLPVPPTPFRVCLPPLI